MFPSKQIKLFVPWFTNIFLFAPTTVVSCVRACNGEGDIVCASICALSHLLTLCLGRRSARLITSHFNVSLHPVCFPNKAAKLLCDMLSAFLTPHPPPPPPPHVFYENTPTFTGLHQRPHWSKTLTLQQNLEQAPATTVPKVYALYLLLDSCMQTRVCVAF